MEAGSPAGRGGTEGKKGQGRGERGRGRAGEWKRGGGEEGAQSSPYLRNFKLNCDVFKLRFLLEPTLFSRLSSSLHQPCTSSLRRFNVKPTR